MTVLRRLADRHHCLLPLAAAVVAIVCAMGLLVVPSVARAASNEVTVAVPVEVSCPSSVADQSQFGFEMVPVDGAPEVAPLKVSCTGGRGSAAFSARFDVPGTYRYRLRQTGTAPVHWTYDSTQWDVLIQVLRADDNSLAPNVVITREGGGTKFAAATFSNDYTPPIAPGDAGGAAPARPRHYGLPKLGDGTVWWIVLLLAAVSVGVVVWRIATRP